MCKHRVTRRCFLREAAAASAGAILAGCAQRNPEVEIVKETVEVICVPEQVEVTRQVEVEVTAVPDAIEPVTVQMWNGDSVNLQVAYNSMAEQFNLTQHAVIAENVNIADGHFDEKLMSLVAAEQGPDCWVSPYPSAHRIMAGHIAVLEPFIEADGIAKDEVWFPPSYELPTFDGKQHGVPRDIGWAAWAYNVDLFEEMGVDPPSPEWDQNEFVDICVALTDKEKGTWGTTASGSDSLLWGAAGYAGSLGFEITSGDGREIVGYLDSETSIAAIQHILDLQVDYGVAPSKADIDMLGGNAFNSGRVGLGRCSTWDWAEEAERPFSWLPLVPPVSDAGERRQWTWSDSVQFLMWSGAEKKPEIWKYLKYCSGPVGSKLPHRFGQWSSPCPEVWEETATEIDGRLSWFPETQQALPYMRSPAHQWSFWDCVLDTYSRIWTRYVENEERPLETIVMEQAELAQICLDDAFAEADSGS